MAIDAAKLKLGRRIVAPAGIWGTALDPESGRLYCGATDFQVYVYDVASAKEQPLRSLSGHTSYVTSAVFSSAAKTVITAGFDRRLLGWRGEGEVAAWSANAGGLVNRLALSADGTLIASAQDDLTVRLWEAATGKAVRTIRGGHAERTTVGRASTLYSVAFSPDGRFVASGDRVGGVCLWETATGTLVHKLSAAALYTQALYDNPLGPNISSEYEWGGVRALTFTNDGKQLLAGGMGPADQNSAGLDGFMLIVAFEVESGKGLTSVKLEKSKGVLYSLQPHPEGRWVFGVGGGGGTGTGGSGAVCAWDYAARDADGKPASVVAFPTAMVARDFTWAKGASSLYAVGMEKGVLAGRIEEWTF